MVKHLDAQGLPTANQMYIIPESFKMNPHNFHNRGLYSVWAHFVEFCIHNNVLVSKQFADIRTEPFFEMSNYRENPHVPQGKRLPVFIHLSMTKPERRPTPYGWAAGPSEAGMQTKDPIRSHHSFDRRDIVPSPATGSFNVYRIDEPRGSLLSTPVMQNNGRYHSIDNDHFLAETGWTGLNHFQERSRPSNPRPQYNDAVPSTLKRSEMMSSRLHFDWQLEGDESYTRAAAENELSFRKTAEPTDQNPLMTFDNRGYYVGGTEDAANQFGMLESPDKTMSTDESHIKTFDEEEDLLDNSQWIRSADTLSLWAPLRHGSRPIFRNFSDQPINQKLEHGDPNSGVDPSPLQTIPTMRWST